MIYDENKEYIRRNIRFVLILSQYHILHETKSARSVANRQQQTLAELAGAGVDGHAKREKARLRGGQVFGAERGIETNLEV